MAQVVKKTNDLIEKYTKSRNIAIIGFIVCGISFILFGVCAMTFTFALSPVCMIGFLGGGGVGGFFSQKASALHSGIAGEETTADIIRSLPDYYCGFQNVRVAYDGKMSEIDMVVVGPTGVFIIETKNMNGTVVGNFDNPQWTQRKIGQQGTPYSRNFYNPIKQVRTHVYRLANYIRSNGVNVHIESMVYFSNPDTAIQLVGTPSDTPVFSALANSSYDICAYITNRPQILGGEQIRRIVNLLNV